MKKQKIKIPLGKGRVAIIYTKDVFDQKTMEELMDYFSKIDWDNNKFLLIPSEYIEKIEFIKIKKLKSLAFARWYSKIGRKI